MRILVTGATGTVGSQVVEHLRGKDGVYVRMGAHHLDRAAGMTGKNVEAVIFDYWQRDTIERALEGIDHVFLLTPPVLEAKEMAAHAIEVMRAIPHLHVVRLSVLNADVEPGITLTRDHREIEQLLEDSGLQWTILRPNSYMENLCTSAEFVRSQGVLYMPLGNARVSYIAANDVGAVAAMVLMTPGHVGTYYDLTGPDAVSGDDIARAISDETQRAVQYMPVHESMFRQALAGMPEERVNQLLEFNASYRAGAGSRVSFTVYDLTGRPAMTLREWMRRHRDIFRPGEARAA